jgi:hypothetical protein
VDAPGWADSSTLWLAQGSQLTVLPVGASVDDLNPTIRLMHELAAKGVQDWRVAIALCRIQNEADGEFARGYLGQAKFSALGHELRESKMYRDVQNVGQAITEATAPGLAAEAKALVHEIGEAMTKSLSRLAALEKGKGTARLVGRDTKDRDRGR